MTLHLTLYKQYFDAILSGEKRIEYRRRSPRYDKQFQNPYTHIKFVNDYGNQRPWLIAEIERFEKTAFLAYLRFYHSITGLFIFSTSARLILIVRVEAGLIASTLPSCINP